MLQYVFWFYLVLLVYLTQNLPVMILSATLHSLPFLVFLSYPSLFVSLNHHVVIFRCVVPFYCPPSFRLALPVLTHGLGCISGLTDSDTVTYGSRQAPCLTP